ncbi:MAG: Crp/Fnr family transcriptional regulator [Bacillaceae bacterium]|nr:Crp/Fnr family transcriptional regulator [Bacillaceae bacterium]
MLQTDRPYSLKNTNLFSEETYNRLKEIMYEQKVEAGTYIFWDSDPADKLYYIKKGHVRITKSTDDGKEFILYLFQDGDLFGEWGSYENARYSYNAVAADECVLGVVQQRDLEILLWQHGEMAVELMKWMGIMHRITQTKFRDLMMYGKTGALCSTLIRLANTYGQETQEGTVISRHFTNTELGDMIGATRESVNRILSDLRSKKVLRYEDGNILIMDIDYLKDVCHCEECPLSVCRI